MPALAGPGPWRAGDDSALAGSSLQPALADQVLHHLGGGVGIDLELCCESAHGRKGIARLKLAGHERLGRGEHDLLENRLAGHERESEYRHLCTMLYGTRYSQ